MKRQFKFRAWDGLNKVMKYYTLKELAGEDKFGCDTEFEAIQSGFDNWKWMQYTGLKDSKGKEIYEGDIIRRFTGYIFKVEVREYGLGGVNQTNAHGYELHPSDEIIGNIYENGNLLNSEQNANASVATGDDSSNEADYQNKN